MAIQEQTITAELFLELVDLPEYQDRVLELVEGEIVEIPTPTRMHGVVAARLTRTIANYVVEKDLGEVTSGDPGFVLERNAYGRDTVRGLDIAFVSQSKVLGPPDFAWYETGPDLAVEVISPSNKAGDIHLKVMQLLNAGTRLIWLVYPETRTVEAHTPEGATTLHESETLSGGDVLPEFEMRVSDIFPG
ncbi:MAG: Uma2 family endonuclease [Chloroflexi bacterium]|nr:Uma2 family endonuclease [Chloroflexota bacterium]